MNIEKIANHSGTWNIITAIIGAIIIFFTMKGTLEQNVFRVEQLEAKTCIIENKVNNMEGQIIRIDTEKRKEYGEIKEILGEIKEFLKTK